MKHYLFFACSLLFNALLPNAARALAPQRPVPSLTEALAADGTLKAGASGAFDTHAFRMTTAPDGKPVFRPTGAGDERWQDGFGLPDGAGGWVSAMVKSGPDVYVGGSFRVVGNVAANFIAKWNGTAWSSVGVGAANGLDGVVMALALAPNGDLYVGGAFERAGGVAANRVARWNGTAWSGIGAGLSAVGDPGTYVDALAVGANGDVYAGGFFNRLGATPSVARWNGTAWSALGTGTTGGVYGTVYALAVAANGHVYAGGAFSNGAFANCIAEWDGTAWSSMGPARSILAEILAIAIAPNGEVYIGGNFGTATTSSGGSVAIGHVAKWNGTDWVALSSGFYNNQGVNGNVHTLAFAPNGDLYVGGSFGATDHGYAAHVAKWDGRLWTPLGPAQTNGTDGYVEALLVTAAGDVYVGGDFQHTGSGPANRIARWNGAGWSTLPGTGNGAGSPVRSLAVATNGDVYVSGAFARVGGVEANQIARWNGTGWSRLGSSTANGVVNGGIAAMAVAPNGNLYAVGGFTGAGGVAGRNVACWNGTAWSGVGGGVTGGGTTEIRAVAVATNGDVYVGGLFTEIGGVAANGIARWDGAAWHSLGTGTANGLPGFGFVNALALAANGDLYVGGNFTAAGGLSANGLARWNGTAWSTLGPPLSARTGWAVNALAVAPNGDLYAGGSFTQNAGALFNGVAKWNGTAWSGLGSGLTIYGNASAPGTVNALVVTATGNLYVGGNFTQAGATAVSRTARWDGTTWSSLGTGANDAVAALAVNPSQDKLYAGGDFGAVGDNSKPMNYFGVYELSTPLATLAASRSPAATLFPNPAHGTVTLHLPALESAAPLVLTDELGRLVRQYPTPVNTHTTIEVGGLPAGTYLLRYGKVSQRLRVE